MLNCPGLRLGQGGGLKEEGIPTERVVTVAPKLGAVTVLLDPASPPEALLFASVPP